MYWSATVFLAAVIRCSHGAGTSDDKKSVAVIGAGYSGLSAALELRLLGYDVIIYEKSNHVGGRSYKWSEAGFTFDAGPSWYWMPHIFENIFAKFGRKSSDFYNLTRLDPAYAVYFGEQDRVDVPGDIKGLVKYITSVEPDSADCIEKFFADGKILYEKGIDEWIWKPMVSLTEFIDPSLVRATLQYNMFGSFEAEVKECVKNEKLRTILKWPVIFLGASPRDAPAMYSLMSYAGHADGTWYPTGGLSAPAEALAQTARDAGVIIKLSAEVEKLDIDEKTVKAVCIKGDGCHTVQGVVAAGDYHHMEQVLLPSHLRRYDEKYWDSQVMSPSVLLYYVGIKRVLPLQHHTFFFDGKLDKSLHASIDEHRMEEDPVFYVTSTSQVDPSTAPKGCSALFILVPISYKLNGTDSQKVRDRIFQSVVSRMEKDVGAFKDDIMFFRDYGPSNFEKEFHAFRGNAFGHANVLEQSLIFKPSMDSLLDNFVFAGHLTNPGPGIPPALASGATAARLLKTKLVPAFLSLRGVLVGICILLLAFRFSLRTELQRSRRDCMRLLYNHGRTFFAGASLMATQQFLDTSAIYGLMRIADDCVDDVDDFVDRKRRIDEFEGIFWRCWHAKSARTADHPVMPAVIETSLRLKFPREWFERFFAAMRSDITENICHTWEDAEQYMEGSAGVVGEFMLPIIMPNASQALMDEARPHAIHLGKAFQLTNFCRDIDEDLDIQRQYIPVELCTKHGVDLRNRTAQQEGFADMFEEMFQRCDAYYESADKGIAMLPENIRPPILVAAKLYQNIQDQVRARDYNIFEERCRVPTKQKLKIASEYIGLGLTFRMVTAELLLLTVFSLDSITSPFCLLVAAWQFCEHFSWPGLTYAGFHLLFTLPAMALLVLLAQLSSPSPEYFKTACKCTGVLCAVATLWTTPWDNYLVYSGVWDYPKDGHVLGVIGYVPLEEYAFFSIETIFVCMVWVCRGQVKIIPHFRKAGPWRMVGLAGFAILFASSFWLLSMDRTFYLGMIVVWSTPILAIQWAFGADALMAQQDAWMPPLIYAWIYLCLIDRWAIKNGCWSIKMETSLPRIDWLPAEEAYFFLVTSTMCIWGLQLAMNVLTLDCGVEVAVQRVLRWARKVEVPAAFQWSPARLHLLCFSLVVVGSLMSLRSVSQETQVFLMVVPSLMVGLPLGKASIVVADWLQIKGAQLCASYVGCFLLVGFGWYACPTVSLLSAAGIAMLQFGHADTKNQPGKVPFIDFVARAGMMLLAARWQPEASSWIVTQLVGGSPVAAMHFLSAFTPFHAVCLIMSIVIHSMKCHKAHHMEFLLEQLLLTAIFLFLPPLLSFTIYFNAFYTPRLLLHASRLSAVRSSLAQLWKRKGSALGGTFVLLMIAAVIVTLFFQKSSDAAFTEGNRSNGRAGTFLKVTFVSLSVVSTPHMLLMSMYLHRSIVSTSTSKDASLTESFAMAV